MADATDPRIPNASSAWQLWHSDTFDSDSLPAVQADGTDIVQGLYQLWLHTLKEAVQDNGHATFSRFHLTWGHTAAARADIFIHPFDNLALLKLRRWAHFLSPPAGTERERVPPNLEEQREWILLRLAQLHYELLQQSRRWNASAIDWAGEARELLARAESMTDPDQLSGSEI